MANNLWRPAGVNNNVNNALNWSLLAVPTSADTNTAVFDNNVLSGPVTINAAFSPNNLDMSLYNNTITMTNNISVTGNIVLGVGMTVAGSGSLTQAATGNLTSNGFTWPNAFLLTGTASTHTLIDNWRVTGTVTFSGLTSKTINGLFTLRCDTNLSLATTGTTTSGTASIRLGGTGTWSHTGSAILRNNITIDTTGTITYGSALAFNTGTFTYVTGTVDATTNSNTFTTSGSATMNLGINCKFYNWNPSTSSITITMLADIYVINTLNTGAATSTNFGGAFTLYVAGSFTIASNGQWNGVSSFVGIVWNGSGATAIWSGAGEVNVNLTINGSGTLTISGNVHFRNQNFIHTSGTVVTTGSTFTMFNGTYDCSGIAWNNVTANVASLTCTLSNPLNVSGTLTLGATAFTVTFNGSVINLSGNLVIGVTSGITTGTTVINITGNSTWTMPSFTTGTMRNPININNLGFTFTLSGSLNYSTGTITYTAGTFAPGSSTLNFGGTLTVNNSGFTLNALVCAANSTFNGTNGFTIASWTCTTAGLTHTFKNGNTYIITTALLLTSTAASLKNIVSSTPGSQFTLKLNQGATQDVYYTNTTDANSSTGQTIWDFKGTISNCINWNNLVPPSSISYSSST